MHYLGSKARHAKDIIAITTAGRRPDQVYVEPFVGGGNVINKVPHGVGRVANDKNYGMVALLDALGNRGWSPPETMTKSEWSKLMKQDISKLDPDGQALYAFAATGPTFGSMWAGQWAKDYPGMEGTRYRQARDAALNDAPGLAGIKFFSGSYDEFHIPERSLIYCDPPYVNTTEYSGAVTTIKVGDGNANLWKAAKFWKWCDDRANQGHTVFVSEYRGPDPGAFKVPPSAELVAEKQAALAAAKALDPADKNIPSSAFEEVRTRIADIEDRIAAAGAAYAARWKVVWQKEVVSDFSATRGSEAEGEGGKKEMELLFTRDV